MQNYMIIKNKNGEVCRKEINKRISSKLYFTTEEKCFSNILNSKMIEDYLRSKKQIKTSEFKNMINGILTERQIQKEIRKTIDTLEGNNIIDTMSLINCFESEIEILEKQKEKIENKEKRTKKESDEKLKLIRTIKYLEMLEEQLLSEKNESGEITEEIIDTIKLQLEKIDMKNTPELIDDLSKDLYQVLNMDTIYKKVLNAQDKRQLIDIYNDILIISNNDDRKESLKRLYDNNSELALSIMTKSLLKSYIHTNLRRFNLQDMYGVEVDICRGIKPSDILAYIDSSVKEIINPEVKNYLNDLFEYELDNKLDEESTVKCFDCTNGYTSRCKKIADIDKEEIQEYPFIIRGYQVIINERLVSFIVGECANFSTIPHYKNRKLTREELTREVAELARLYHEKLTGMDPIAKELKKLPNNKRIQ